MTGTAASTDQNDDTCVLGSHETDDDLHEAEMTWGVTHARGLIVGVAVAIGGFWGPLILICSLWGRWG